MISKRSTRQNPFIIKDNKEQKFASPFIVEVDELKLFVLAFEEIVYAKGKVSKTNVIVTDKEAAEKGAAYTD